MHRCGISENGGLKIHWNLWSLAEIRITEDERASAMPPLCLPRRLRIVLVKLWASSGNEPTIAIYVKSSA